MAAPARRHRMKVVVFMVCAVSMNKGSDDIVDLDRLPDQVEGGALFPDSVDDEVCDRTVGAAAQEVGDVGVDVGGHVGVVGEVAVAVELVEGRAGGSAF